MLNLDRDITLRLNLDGDDLDRKRKSGVVFSVFIPRTGDFVGKLRAYGDAKVKSNGNNATCLLLFARTAHGCDVNAYVERASVSRSEHTLALLSL